MPTIKVSETTKARMEKLIADKLREKIENAKGNDKAALFLQLVKHRYGLSFDNFLIELMDVYTKDTK